MIKPLWALLDRVSAYIGGVTVLETIQRSAEFLTRKGVESPRLNAELLLARVLNLPRMRLYLEFERSLAAAELDLMRDHVKRRGMREPLQHILGSTNFCGFEFRVDSRVLVPRPETELLAEAAWQFLNGLEGPSAVLDYGTGSGCLAVTLALKEIRCRVLAIDISPAALCVAGENAATHKMEGRISFLESDRLAALPDETKLDLIVANPPYIPTGEVPGLEPEVRQFDPISALDGGADGLDHYRFLAGEAGRWLVATGKLMLEIGDGQEVAVRGLLEGQNWIVEAEVRDYNQRPRIIVACRR